MNRIKTSSFDLAIYKLGDNNAKKLAIVCPGLLDPKSYPHMKAHVDFLAHRGFFALSFDPPGTWDSGGDIGSYTITNYLKAVDELIKYFGSKKTIILGHSLGGTVSMLAAIRNQKINGFVAIMSPSILTAARAINEKTKKWKEEGVRIVFRDVAQGSSGKRRYELPYSFLKDARTHNALPSLSKLTKPKLFIAGVNDSSVEPEIVEEAYNTSANPKELYTVMSDHNYRNHKSLINDVNARIALFVASNNL